MNHGPCKKAVQRSLLERLQASSVQCSLLTEQYRMPALLGDLVSRLSYHGKPGPGIMIDKGPTSTLRRYLSEAPDALPNEKARKQKNCGTGIIFLPVTTNLGLARWTA